MTSGRAAVWAAGWLAVVASCGGDVDLGGAAPAPCEPCASAASCGGNATCALVGGQARCATLCPAGTECAQGEVCASAAGADGGAARACLPASGSCPSVVGPSVDGAVLERCGNDVGPAVAAGCRACSKSSPSCQANGCYGGYWCDTVTADCERPPRACP